MSLSFQKGTLFVFHLHHQSLIFRIPHRLVKNQTLEIHHKPNPLTCICSVVCNCVGPSGLEPTKHICPWDFKGKNTGVGCHFFLQGIFPTQGSNSCLLCLLHLGGGFFTTKPPGKPILSQYSSCQKIRTQPFQLLRSHPRILYFLYVSQ